MEDIKVIYPDLKKVEIGGKTYKVNRLSIRLLFDFLRLFGKVLEKVNLEQELTNLNSLVPLIMSVVEIQDDFIEFLAKVINASKEEVEYFAIDDVMKIIKAIDEQDRITEKVKGFFKNQDKIPKGRKT